MLLEERTMTGDGRRLLRCMEQKLKRGRPVEDEPKSADIIFTPNGERIGDEETAISTCLSSREWSVFLTYL